MDLILWLAVFLVPLVTGRGALLVFHGKKDNGGLTYGEAYVTGLLLCILLAWAAHLTAVFLNWDLAGVILFMGILLAAAFLVALCVILINRDFPRWPEGSGEKSSAVRGFYLGFGILVILQIVFIMTKTVLYQTDDITLETISTFLSSGKIYEMNPLTGQAYESGIPMRLKILVLPTLYSALCTIAASDVSQVVGRMLPCVILLAAYLVYGRLAKVLFEKESAKRGLFLLIIALLFWLGTYADVMDGFGVLYCGYRGITIRNVILIPYTICLCLEKKWLRVLICIFVEAGIVWTFYGLGACLLTAVLLFALNLQRVPGGSTPISFCRKEGSSCRNS